MAQDAYQKLRKHLDDLPAGFPATDSGVEIRILQRLFTPEEAELALKVSLIPEQAPVIARRARLTVDQAASRLDEMAAKGLIFRYERKGAAYYMAAQFAIGIWEYHVNDLDPQLIADVDEYIPHLVNPEAWKRAPQLRTIPVGRSIDASITTMPYERAEELVREQKHLLVAPCICRKEHQMVDKGCEKPLEACLVFGPGVQYYENNGLGRRIDVAECLEILKKADKAGLVLQPSNSQKIVNICCCCGCCCRVLQNVKKADKPAEVAASPFVARFEAAKCDGCGVCLARCQMDAFTLPVKKEPATYDPDRCIGCGLCVATCPSGALTLERKPEQLAPQPPANHMRAMIQTGRARGKLGPAAMAMMALRSKVDRLLAAKK